MEIRHLTIERFRGLKFAELVPGRRNVLLGPNNAGKSTYLEALDLALHPGLGRPRRPPDELEYYGRAPVPDGFVIEVTLGALDRRFKAQVRDHLEGWDAKTERVVADVDGDDIETVVRVRVRGTEDFDLIHDFAKDESEGVRFGPRLRRQIGWLYDGRSRDPAWQMTFHRGGVLDRLFDGGSELAEALGIVREAMSDGATGFANDEVVKRVLTEIGGDLHRLALLTSELLPGFELGGVSEREILQMLRLALPDAGGFRIPLSRQGRGVQRLLLVASLLRLAKTDTERPPIGAFEEPEEALEPTRQAQMAEMIVGLSDQGGQVFVVTHSPDIVRAFGANDLILVSDDPRGAATELRRVLGTRSRRGYERFLDGAVARALFCRVPILVEGPGDCAVLGVFWDALANGRHVRGRYPLGLEFVNCDGAGNQPLLAQLLCEARKPVVAWAELDRSDTIKAIRNEGHCTVIVLYPNDKRFHKLEGALVHAYPVGILAQAMSAVADARGIIWEDQREDIYSRCPHSALSDELKATLKSAADLTEMLEALPEQTARDLAAEALVGKLAPFEIKNNRQARLLAEALVSRAGVADAFRTPMVALDRWIADGCRPKADEITMPLS